jgi:iron complex outermembrane receptor protein
MFKAPASFPLRSLIALTLSVAIASAAHAEMDLTELSLQELTNVKVTTFAKRPQRAADVAAALFVITQDDIRRSGATSIPDALRLAPGLQVAQIDGNAWSISARGFSGRFSNKLLVMMDGRTLYTPSFAGVYWDVQDTAMDDIERIEVIRGPAGTTWGTNAVNGIINIITKHSDQTGGLLVSSDVGVDGSANATVRFGDADGDRTQWRVYAKAFERDANQLVSGADGFDEASQQRIGARVDTETRHGDELRWAMEAYQGHSHQNFTGSFMQPLRGSNVPVYGGLEGLDGIWTTAGWARESGNGSRLEVQTYFDHSDRRGPLFGEQRDTVDLEFQHSLARHGVHTFTWGLGVRHSISEMPVREDIALDRDGEKVFFGSAYLQDELHLMGDRLTLTAGARLEDSNTEPLEFMPNLRARFAFTDTSAVWAAVGRGVRRPGRIEEDFHIDQVGEVMPPGSSINPFPIPVVQSLHGDNRFRSEELTAYESGWRWQARENISVDLALFYNEYEHLRTLEVLTPYCAPGGEPVMQNPMCLFSSTHVVIPATAGNSTSGTFKGGELALGWAPLSYWRLTGTYSHLDTELRGANLNPSTLLFVLGQDARHVYALRSSLSMGPRWDWDLFVKHRTDIESSQLPSLTQMDMRLAWRPTLDLELSLVGRNLLEDAEVQSSSELYDIAHTAIERKVYAQLRWSFR